MSLLKQKFAEVLQSLLPVMVLVLILAVALGQVEAGLILRFILGGGLLLIGLAIFLWGVDLAMNPIGDHLAREVATSKTAARFAVLSFLLGFLVTVAEPDLLILGRQVDSASGGAIQAQILVYVVSAGVGLLIALGSYRLLHGGSYRLMMALSYCVNFALAFKVSEAFFAISFDASGATTGALTTPFVLALSAGLARVKGGRDAEADSFGLVGAMSAGPILAVLLMSILTGQKEAHGVAEAFQTQNGVLGPLLHALPENAKESFLALLPLSALFFIFNLRSFKLKKRELFGILRGLAYTLLGLALFLTGVNSGFMDMGRILGRDLAHRYAAFLPFVGFLLGMIVVLVEPAVLVLGRQVEEATGGRVPVKLIKGALSLGVGLAVALAMVRIMVPEVKLWHFLLPGFALAIALSFKADPLFVGIAYDAGGVASGPMTATFVLAFARGAAEMTPTADVMVDGFGVIAMVAMTPVLAIMALGALIRHQEAAVPVKKAEAPQPQALPSGAVAAYDCVLLVLRRGLAQRAVELAREKGAGGATILHGRGSGGHDLHLFHIELQKEKEVIFWICDSRVSHLIAAHLYSELDLGGEGGGSVFMLPAQAMGLSGQSARDLQEETERALSGGEA